MKGWYISSRLDRVPGDTTNWYTSFWHFISDYANIPVERRQEYMAVLEKASVDEDITDFTLFLASLVKTE